jgi:hypothetical protein
MGKLPAYPGFQRLGLPVVGQFPVVGRPVLPRLRLKRLFPPVVKRFIQGDKRVPEILPVNVLEEGPVPLLRRGGSPLLRKARGYPGVAPEYFVPLAVRLRGDIGVVRPGPRIPVGLLKGRSRFKPGRVFKKFLVGLEKGFMRPVVKPFRRRDDIPVIIPDDNIVELPVVFCVFINIAFAVVIAEFISVCL